MIEEEEYWGINLGGNKIEILVLTNLDAPLVKARMRVPTEKEKGYQHIINQVALGIELTSRQSGTKPKKIGLSVPGIIDPFNKLHKNASITVLNYRDFARDLQNSIGIEFIIENNANCMTLAEATLGAVPLIAPEAKSVFGMYIATGVGGGWMFNGKLHKGKHFLAGEWGHNYLDSSGGICYCGKSGCVEMLLSIPSLEKYYADISGGDKKDLKTILEKAAFGNDEYSNKTLDRFSFYFGLALSTVINIIDPEVIILGGEVGNMPSLFTKAIEEVKKYVFNNQLDTVFVKPKLGDSGSVFGAALIGAGKYVY